MKVTGLGVLAAVLIAATSVTAQRRTAAPLSAGNGTIYVGTYAGNIAIIDEATEKVVGEIKLKTGMPRALALSDDRTKFVVLDSIMQNIEIVDIATRKTIDTFTLSEGNTRTLIRAYATDPMNRFMVLVARDSRKLIDRWEIGPLVLLQYDLAAKKVVRTIPWPKGDERDLRPAIRFSPDGKLMYFFAEDVTIYDTSDFREVATWELSRPVEAGAGRIDFGAVDDYFDERGFFTGLFTMEDPVKHRRMMGIGRVNLASREVDFYTIGPAERVGFTLAPDRKRGYGLMQNIGRYEFWTFDLEKRKLHSRTEFPGRPRMDLNVSSSGKILYLWQAGNTIDLYEADTYKYLRTISLNADTTTRLYVVPSKAPAARTTSH